MSAHAFTLYDMLLRNASIYGDRPAVIHAQGQLTFRDFLARVDALATGLAALPDLPGALSPLARSTTEHGLGWGMDLGREELRKRHAGA